MQMQQLYMEKPNISDLPCAPFVPGSSGLLLKHKPAQPAHDLYKDSINGFRFPPLRKQENDNHMAGQKQWVAC